MTPTFPRTAINQLLFIMILLISSISRAETTASTSVESTAESTDNLIVAENMTLASTNSVITQISESSDRSTDNSINKSNDVRQELTRIITSEDYALAQEVKHWQAIDQSEKTTADLNWLQKWLESIFGNNNIDNPQASFALFSMVLKVLLIGALIVFIIWVLRRAGYLAGWAERINKHTGRRSTSRQDEINSQQQGWEQLPAHEDIPSIIKPYLADGKLIQAASILYRASLRWLVRTQQMPIAAANTEQQCLAQIQQLTAAQKSKDNDSKAYHYISQIISLWVQIAYDQQQRVQHSEQLMRQLQSHADNWLQHLPLSADNDSNSDSVTRYSNAHNLHNSQGLGAHDPQQGAR